VVLSAPYPGSEDENNATFHEWLLERPGDILQVYFLIQNIDRWTVGRFLERVVIGVNELVEAVMHNKAKYDPWRRCGDLGSGILHKIKKENVNTTPSATTASASSSSPQAKRKGKRRH
jgi:solute carrier family 25 (mitochondrial carnitine/acylcarnitine transporter), member 20/29